MEIEIKERDMTATEARKIYQSFRAVYSSKVGQTTLEAMTVEQLRAYTSHLRDQLTKEENALEERRFRPEYMPKGRETKREKDIKVTIWDLNKRLAAIKAIGLLRINNISLEG
jgi:hypothetical protein